jgi:type III secretory pathway component EscR
MHRIYRFSILSAFVLSAALAAPIALRAEDNNHNEKRYYDKQGKDYHTWNDNEDHAYRSYLTEQHQSYRSFNKQPAAKQQVYFNWRHDHPDSSIKVEIK